MFQFDHKGIFYQIAAISQLKIKHFLDSGKAKHFRKSA